MNDDRYDEISNLDHDPGTATALGNMIVSWSKAEAMLCMCMAEVMAIHPDKAILIFSRVPNLESKIKMLSSLLEAWDNPKNLNKEDIVQCICSLSKLSKTRNDWVHCLWAKHARTKRTVIVDDRKQPGNRLTIVHENAVKNHNAAVNEQTEKLIALVPGYILPD